MFTFLETLLLTIFGISISKSSEFTEKLEVNWMVSPVFLILAGTVIFFDFPCSSKVPLIVNSFSFSDSLDTSKSTILPLKVAFGFLSLCIYFSF